MRFLAIDLGDRRTGFAVGDDETGLVTPVAVEQIDASNGQLDGVQRQIRTHEPDALVVGLPLNMDGTEGPRAQLVRAFVRKLESTLQLPVHVQDERLTSFAAEQHLNRSGRTHRQKKQMRDALAAAEILRDFLDG